MARGKVTDASNWLALAGAGFYLLVVATPLGAPQVGSNTRPPVLSRRAGSDKPAWQSGPATTPPETEVLPPHPSNPPPAKSPGLRSPVEGKEPAVRKPWGTSSARSGFLERHPSAAVHGLAPKPTAVPRGGPGSTDPEAQRIQTEFNRLRNDAGARQAFYDELRRTVERVRAGQPNEDSKNLPSPHTGWHKFRDASREPSNPQPADQPDEPPAANPGGPQAYLGSRVGAGSPWRPPAQDSHPQTSSGSFVGAGSPWRLPPTDARAQGSAAAPPGDPPAQLSPLLLGGEGPGVGRGSANATIDRAAYERVIRCAKANGAPVPLALGVAWAESHLQTHPPRGAAGEVGMFQILPARCRIEGWPAKRLKDPEFNAWLGTLLLARYYREEGSWARAAAKYVGGPRVFEKSYTPSLWAYMNWYASSVESYAGYFSRYQS